MKTMIHLATKLCLLFAPISLAFAQGSLTPPGAPAATMKTLDQLDAKLEKRTPISALPFTISAPGAFYVTSNLTTSVGGNGITISASGVTLDLNGFELVGNGSPGLFGIRVSASRTNVTIRNGTVRSWTGSGVVTENTAVSGVRVESVRALGNGSAGIALGIGCVVIDCLASGNVANGISTSGDSLVLRCTSTGNTPSGDGIQVGTRCAVRECVATGNSGDGIQTGDSCEISSCSVSGNTGTGVFTTNGCGLRDCVADGNGGIGFQCGTASGAIGCTATDNGGAGFSFGNNARLSQCTASSNTGNGITTAAGATVHACMAALNTASGIVGGAGSVVADSSAASNLGTSGIVVGTDGVVRGCTVEANTSSAANSQGISGGSGSLIVHCSVGSTTSTAALTASTGMGIAVLGGSTVEACNVRGNTGDGIRGTSNCRIVGNVCDSNGAIGGDGAGIHVTSVRNRIDGNHCTSNDRGIDVDANINTIVRNTASANTVNYDLAASNSVGPIVIPANSNAINTNVALPSSLGTTDPWANFSE